MTILGKDATMSRTRNLTAAAAVVLLVSTTSGALAGSRPPRPHPSGTITVVKSLVPAGDAGRFDLRIGATTYTNGGAGYGDGGSTGARAVVASSRITVSELAHRGTGIRDYGSSYACTREGAPYRSGAGTRVDVGVGSGDDVVCTFTNTRRGGTIELRKVWSGGTATTTLTVGSSVGDGDVASTTVGTDGTTAPQAVGPGTYYLGETEVPGFSAALTCLNLAGGRSTPVSAGAFDGVAVGAGDRIVCTFTNTANAVRPIDNDCSGGSVAFTFDDGPSENTPALLRKLSELNLKATFFVVGQSIDSAEMKQVIRDEAAAGFTIGNHTNDHASFTGQSTGSAPLTVAQATAELEDASAAIVDAGGPRPSLYRPPYGDVDNAYDLVARTLGYRVVLSYGTASDSIAGDGNIVDSDDYSGISAAEIAERVTQGYTRVLNGVTYRWHGIQADTIVAMHDGSGPEAQNTIDSLQQIVDYMNANHLCSTSTIRPDATGNIVSPPPPPVPTSGNLIQNPGLEQVRAPGTAHRRARLLAALGLRRQHAGLDAHERRALGSRRPAARRDGLEQRRRQARRDPACVGGGVPGDGDARRDLLDVGLVQGRLAAAGVGGDRRQHRDLLSHRGGNVGLLAGKPVGAAVRGLEPRLLQDGTAAGGRDGDQLGPRDQGGWKPDDRRLHDGGELEACCALGVPSGAVPGQARVCRRPWRMLVARVRTPVRPGAVPGADVRGRGRCAASL